MASRSSVHAAAIESYDLLASIYAHHFGNEASRALPVYDRLVLSRLSTHAHILDVCCGTGQLARDLTLAGFRVTGIDASAKMLHHARRMAPAATFICADVTSFTLPGAFDCALSTFNSFAHLRSSDELVEAFAHVHGCLHAGAPFAFDLYMDEAYRRRWRGSFTVALDNRSCTVSPSYDPVTRRASNLIRVFDQRSRELLNEVTLAQHCFAASDVLSALQVAGFTGVRVYDAALDFARADEQGRSFFSCRKAA